MKRYLKYIIMGIVAVTLYTLFFPGKDKEKGKPRDYQLLRVLRALVDAVVLARPRGAYGLLGVARVVPPGLLGAHRRGRGAGLVGAEAPPPRPPRARSGGCQRAGHRAPHASKDDRRSGQRVRALRAKPGREGRAAAPSPRPAQPRAPGHHHRVRVGERGLRSDKIAIQWVGTSPSNAVDSYYVFLVPVLSVLFAFTGKPIFTMFLFRLWNRTNEHLVTYLNLCLQVVFLTCEIYIGLYNLCNFNVAISIILIVELMIDVVIGLKLFHNQSI